MQRAISVPKTPIPRNPRTALADESTRLGDLSLAYLPRNPDDHDPERELARNAFYEARQVLETALESIGSAPEASTGGRIAARVAETLSVKDADFLSAIYANPGLKEARIALNGSLAVLTSAGLGRQELHRLVDLSISTFEVLRNGSQ